MYTLTDEETGQLLATFTPADYPRGSPAIALKMAATEAKRRARSGETLLLRGPDLPERRYAPPYVRRAPTRPYRVRCERCGGWMHPVRRSEGSVCRACYPATIPAAQRERAKVAARRKG